MQFYTLQSTICALHSTAPNSSALFGTEQNSTYLHTHTQTTRDSIGVGGWRPRATPRGQGSRCLFATASLSKITSGGCLNNTLMAAGTKRSSAIGGARRVAASTTSGTRTELRLLKPVENPGLTHRRRACEHLVCALDLLANLQAGGDSLVDTTFEGLQKWMSRMS